MEEVMRSVPEMVKDNQRVTFKYYRDQHLYYATSCGFIFPVPIADAGTAVFQADDKAIFFMRWIRKAVADVKAEEVEAEGHHEALR